MSTDAFARLTDLKLENDGHAALMASMRPRFERMANRHENGTAPRAVAAFQLFQTPPEIARRLVAALKLQHGETVLEPSAGLGRILDALPDNLREVVAVEVDAALAGELFRQARERVTLLQRDFLTMQPGAQLFDAVAMNPPFHMRADIRHILHARRFLRPGGRLAALCLDTSHRTAALKPHAETWEPLPAGTFAKEGTRVPTVLLTIRNHC